MPVGTSSEKSAEGVSMKEIPEIIPVKREFFERFGLPFAPGTIFQHRTKGGPLRAYTAKDPSGRVVFLLRRYLEDLQRNIDREGNNERRF